MFAKDELKQYDLMAIYLIRGKSMKTKRNQLTRLSVATAFTGVLAATTLTSAQAQDGFVESLKKSKSSLSFRLRHEEVSQEGLTDAGATTLRTRLNFTTGAFNGWSGFVELDHVGELQDVDYRVAPNDPLNAGTVAVLDPDGADLNQALIQYKSGASTIKIGRQRIILDNQRFVGGVGWRQNEQTYDGISGSFNTSDKGNIFAAYIKNVNRIFGDSNPIGDHAGDTVLLNGSYKFQPGKLTAYAYLIDNDNVADFSTSTYGLRFNGKADALGYTLEYATQSDYKDNPLSYSASYLALEGSYSFDAVKLTAGYQVLGADGSDGVFITPLATLHAFQGWSDRFLAGGRGNIAGGIQDLYFSAGKKIAGVNASIVYHTFESDDSDASGLDSLGSELSFVLKGKIGPAGWLLKYADYSADDHATDTDILWLMATFAL